MTPRSKADENGTLRAADIYQCPYNVSSDEYPLCTESSSESIYLDPNVPTEKYDLCQTTWIGDGLCDDSCRISDCGDDGGDCDDGNGCVEDGYCNEMHEAWTYFSLGQDKVDHSYVCTTIWPIMITTLGAAPPNGTECWYYVNDSDYNGDGMLNFRELVPLAYIAFVAEWEMHEREAQVNCSECTGMESYNV